MEINGIQDNRLFSFGMDREFNLGQDTDGMRCRHCTNIDNFKLSVRGTRGERVALLGEAKTVDTAVRLKRGDTDTCSSIKDANLLVTAASNKGITIRLPDTAVDRV